MIQKLANSACFWSYLSSLPDHGPSCVESLRRRAADAMILCAIGDAHCVADDGDTLFDAIVEWIPKAYSDAGERISFVQSPICLPYRHIHDPWFESHTRRDIDSIHSITRGDGMEVHDDDEYWDRIKADWGHHLSSLVRRTVIVTRVRRDSPCPKTFPVENRPVLFGKRRSDGKYLRKQNKQLSEPATIDLDELMMSEDAEACFVHTSSQVEFATLTTTLCCEIRSTIAEQMCFSLDPSSQILSGVEFTAEDDSGQTPVSPASKARYTANFGASKQPQGYEAGEMNRQYFGSRMVTASYKSGEQNTAKRSFTDVWLLDSYCQGHWSLFC